MIYKMFPLVEDRQQIYARIDDDGKCYYTCTAENQAYLDWLAEGNTPLPAVTPSE